MMKENWLPCLESLKLKSCTSLKVVPILPLHLKYLEVENCPELMQLPHLTNLSPTLTGLITADCPNLPLPSTFNKPLGLYDLSALTNLEALQLKGIPNLQVVTNLSPTLICLGIEDCPKLTRLGNLQPLYWLSIVRCPMLKREEASVLEGGVVEGDTVNRLPHVERITADDLLLVLELVQQQAFSSIKVLTLRDCAAVPNLEMLSSLKTLSVEGCPDVKSLHNLPVSLQVLIIHGCPKLTKLGNLQRCTSLYSLKIFKCPMLRREEAELVEGVAEGDMVNRLLPLLNYIETDDPLLVIELVQQQHALSSITSLTLKDCAAMPNLEMLSSLETLRIEDCPDVESLPNLPISLLSICIRRCPKLKNKYEKGGPLRNTISHIPDIHTYR